MDIRQETIAVITAINTHKEKSLEERSKDMPQLISTVCRYFDFMRQQDIQPQDKTFLMYIANYVGMPQFYDMLEKFDKDTSMEDIGLVDFTSMFADSSLYINDTEKAHRYQKQILDKISNESKPNRYFLSASTSFGKTHLVFDILKKMEYTNILLLFPTVALLAENFEKVLKDSWLKEKYKIHTLSDVPTENIGDKNIFIYTPERFLSFYDKSINKIHFDFVFVDEVYKIDNEYIIDEEVKENERDTAYRVSIFDSLTETNDLLLVGPYIEFSKNPNSFDEFLKRNNIKLINFNDIEIVNKSLTPLEGNKISFDDIEVKFSGITSIISKASHLVSQLLKQNNKENNIIYCHSRNQAEKCAKEIAKDLTVDKITDLSYLSFLEHINNTFSTDWCLYQTLQKRVAFHHGLVPKYMQKEIIRLFNEGEIKALATTTTITEGVNTSAKNVIITSHKKGKKVLRTFDAKNITGRAGRFTYHYSGRVFILDKEFKTILHNTDEPIKHKNYDLSSTKDDVDLMYSPQEFLTEEDKQKDIKIKQIMKQLNLPEEIFHQYKTIERSVKITMLKDIQQKLKHDSIGLLTECIRKASMPNPQIDWKGFQIILQIIKPAVKEPKLKLLIDKKAKNNTSYFSILTCMLSNYLEKGFNGLFKYCIEEKDYTIDKAVSETADFVYSTLKYSLVKYLGVFNLLFKYHLSIVQNKNMNDVIAFDKLLSKLEYNAFAPNARIASDYGATNKIISYYEDDNKNKEQKKQEFDDYEKTLFERIEKIIE